ncbi:protein tipE [Onthophagus taurus]|uniref:protein tipE n=1 Tax=Onthophagus taurus TaxID=166361 RepID=UPI000C208E23|nr:protein tipE [Onthophagus taurus]
MGEQANKQTWKQKLLFYITAFFVLLGTFSLFSFLFLVPFVIDPAFTTIFMEFDETPALCVTVDNEKRQGASNCTWTSCREGCTKEIYTCSQLRVNYKRNVTENSTGVTSTTEFTSAREERSLLRDDYDYMKEDEEDYPNEVEPTGLMGDSSEWYYTGAKLFPNVKGCGYPPMLNCSIFYQRYQDLGTNFSCYYSRVDPGLVITDLDMWQVYMNLVYAMAIPIPSFILSVIYLTFAYFKIYNDDDEKTPLKNNAEEMDVEGESVQETVLQPASGVLTPASEAFREDIAGFGHNFVVAMADEISRESLADGVVNSISIQGNIERTITTSISINAGPIADI